MQRPQETNSKPSAHEAPPSARYSWAVVGMLWFICFFNYADRQAIFSVFPILEEEFGFTKEQLGMIGSAFAAVYGLTAPLAGQISDGASRKLVILGGLYIWSVVTGFTAVCSKVWQFVLVRGAEGLGETVYFPASMSLISDYHSKRTRSRAMGLHQTSVYAGTVGGGALAGWMGQHYGWQSPFILLGVAGVVLGLLLAVFIREPKRDEAERRESGVADSEPVAPRVPIAEFLRGLASTPTALLLILGFLGANSVGMVFLTWMPTFMHEKFELSLTQAALTATVYLQVGSMVGSLLGGVMADVLRKHTRGGRMYVQAMGALCGAPFVYLCGITTDLDSVKLGLIALGLCKGVYDSNIWASLYDVVPPSRRSTSVGLMNMIGWSGGAVLAVVIGRVVDQGTPMSVAIAWTAAIYLTVAVVLFGAGALVPRKPAGSLAADA